MSSWELSEISETIVSVCKSYLLPVKSINILKFTNLALNTWYLGKVFTIEGSKLTAKYNWNKLEKMLRVDIKDTLWFPMLNEN